jgi:hypothetical protein
MNKIAVIYLLRKGNDLSLLKTFLNSYLKYNAGLEHDLIIIFKGYQIFDSKNDFESILSEIKYSSIYIDDIGFDLDAYFNTAKKLHHDYFIFFNSYSIIQSEKWLIKYYNLCLLDNIGIVGASGSFESPVRNWKEEYFSKKSFFLKPQIKTLKLFKHFIYLNIYYRNFPNPHIRTNAFMISSNNLKKIKYKPILDRSQALLLESGKKSITNQLIDHNLRPLIVGKDGNGFDINLWKESNTFRLNNQENLLISDNRTLNYELQSKDDKKKLSYISWGE